MNHLETSLRILVCCLLPVSLQLILNRNKLVTARQRSYRKVMFSVMFSNGGPHVTITNDAFDHNVQANTP